MKTALSMIDYRLCKRQTEAPKKDNSTSRLPRSQNSLPIVTTLFCLRKCATRLILAKLTLAGQQLSPTSSMVV